MSHRTENTQNQESCLASRLLYSFLSACPREQIYDAFDDMEKMLKLYLYTEFADDNKERTSFVFSSEIIQQLGEIVKTIPEEAIEKLRLEVAEKLKAISK